jgi:hypothetical protein
MAHGPKSVDITEAPTNSRQWGTALGKLYADLLNRKRDEKEVRTAAKVATVACDFAHAETRRALAMKAMGFQMKTVEPVPMGLLEITTAAPADSASPSFPATASASSQSRA